MKYTYEIFALFIGVLLGYITIHSLFAHSWLSLLLWAVGGLVFAMFIKERKDIIAAGAVYGFFLCFFWLQFGFSGEPGKRLGLTILALVLSILAALIGAVWFLLIYAFKRRLRKS